MKRLTGLFFVIMLVASSCKKRLDINTNPNQPTEVTPNVVLSSALVATASNSVFDFTNVSRWMGYWSRSGNYVPDVQTETYTIPNDYTNAEWTNIYLNLNNYDYIEKTGRALEYPFYQAVGKVMKAYNFKILVDMYNDVPYSEAFNIATTIQPKYDKAEDIYVDLIHQCDSAIYYFELAKAFYSTHPSTFSGTDDQYDVMFGSAKTGASAADDRVSLWEKFTNTVHLNLLLTISGAGTQAGLVTSEIDSINANGYGFLGADTSATVNPGYTASTGKINPMYSLFRTLTAATSQDAYFRANTYAVNFYNNTGDERQALTYTGASSTPGSNYDGDPAAVSNALTAGIGPGILKDFTQDAPILMDFQSLFLQAEAIERGFHIPGDAKTLYESGVTQNYVYLATNSGDIVTDPVGDAALYLSSGTALADWTASGNKLELILTQKWIAEDGIDWVTAYTDYRRTGYPTADVLGISKAPSHVEAALPTRFLYPQTEFNTNGANVPQLGANGQYTKVFWNQ